MVEWGHSYRKKCALKVFAYKVSETSSFFLTLKKITHWNSVLYLPIMMKDLPNRTNFSGFFLFEKKKTFFLLLHLFFSIGYSSSLCVQTRNDSNVFVSDLLSEGVNSCLKLYFWLFAEINSWYEVLWASSYFVLTRVKYLV
jgi:hypothetical protein